MRGWSVLRRCPYHVVARGKSRGWAQNWAHVGKSLSLDSLRGCPLGNPSPSRLRLHGCERYWKPKTATGVLKPIDAAKGARQGARPAATILRGYKLLGRYLGACSSIAWKSIPARKSWSRSSGAKDAPQDSQRMRKINRRTTTPSCRSPTDRKNAAVIVPAQRPCTQGSLQLVL